MKNFAVKIAVMLAFLLMMAPAVYAYQVTLYQNAYSYSNGGEFRAVDSSLNWVLSNYASKVNYLGPVSPLGFETFCLEYNEEFYPGSLYNVKLSPNAVSGDAPAGFDPISKGTAWLYYEFAKGNLAGYDYTAASRNADAGLLQQAIWWLEDEPNGVKTAFADLAIAKFGSINDAKADAYGAYGVKAMNLTVPGTGAYSQDQLVLVPEPGTLLLLGFGLLGGAAFVRRFRK